MNDPVTHIWTYRDVAVFRPWLRRALETLQAPQLLDMPKLLPQPRLRRNAI